MAYNQQACDARHNAIRWTIGLLITMITGAFIYTFMQYLAVSEDLRCVTEKQSEITQRLLEERNLTTHRLAEIREIGVQHTEQIRYVREKLEAMSQTINRIAGKPESGGKVEQKEYAKWRE